MQDKLDAVYGTKTDVPQGDVLLARLLSASVAPTGREEIRIKQLLKCPWAHLGPINSAKVVASALNFTQAVFKRVDSRLIFITSSPRVPMQEAFDIVSFPADRITPATFIRHYPK